jgi:hypothetical protein
VGEIEECLKLAPDGTEARSVERSILLTALQYGEKPGPAGIAFSQALTALIDGCLVEDLADIIQFILELVAQFDGWKVRSLELVDQVFRGPSASVYEVQDEQEAQRCNEREQEHPVAQLKSFEHDA